jgi:uncharacterized membrane protein
MLDAIIALLTAAVAFVGSHFVLAAPRMRANLVKRLGLQLFTILYSAVALVTIVVFVIAYRESPTMELWPATPALRLVPVFVMPFAALLVFCGLSQRNPTLVMQGFDTAARNPAPGILKVTRHPVLWGIGLWALAHMAANGDIAALIFFGSFAFLALFGTTQIEAKRRAREPEGFARFEEVTSNVPLVALLSTKKRNFWKTAYGIDPLKTVWSEIGLWRVAAALALYVTLVVAHPWLTGASVL